MAVDNRIPTVLFSLEKEEGDIVKDLLPIQFSRYTDNIAGLATASEEEWDKVKDEIITLSKTPLFIDYSIEVSVGEMNAMAQIIISEEKVRVIIIDGIYLLEEENVSQQMRIPSTKIMKCEMDFEKGSVIVDETSMKVKVNSTKKYNTDYGWVVVIYMDLINIVNTEKI